MARWRKGKLEYFLPGSLPAGPKLGRGSVLLKATAPTRDPLLAVATAMALSLSRFCSFFLPFT